MDVIADNNIKVTINFLPSGYKNSPVNTHKKGKIIMQSNNLFLLKLTMLITYIVYIEFSHMPYKFLYTTYE